MSHRLYCTRLTLTDFRNHAALDLDLDGRPVCLYGANGAGKTNILEALTMFAPGRGLRGAGLLDLARGGEAAAADRPRPWSVAARLQVEGETMQLGVGAERTPEGGTKRIARLNGESATPGDLAAVARMTWVIPAMDRLFAGPPADRRRFFDRMTIARAPEHGVQAAAYERAMRERQRLLSEPGYDAQWLAGLEREMAGHGAAIAAARVETLELLRRAIAQRPDGAFPKADIVLEGALEEQFLAHEKSFDVEDRFARALHDARARDAAIGRALAGPHRSDLTVRHQAKDMPAEHCSTGEQKALLLGLFLAHARALADDPGAGPALLLIDEAAAHLDAERRAALFDELLANPGQAWLTGTDANLFEAFGDRAQLFRIGA
ncbi:MAG: DNA replication/repair protein RecF [Hydrogenophilaceae bacterium]|jgi:DNA replication and repair protein RecF|nr:DNA replication/repair protein RecF [Hydrogenophilaceae bacterium]